MKARQKWDLLVLNSRGFVNFVMSNWRNFEKFHALKNVKKLTFSKVHQGQNVSKKKRFFCFSHHLIELVELIPNMYILLCFDQVLGLKSWKYYKKLKREKNHCFGRKREISPLSTKYRLSKLLHSDSALETEYYNVASNECQHSQNFP